MVLKEKCIKILKVATRDKVIVVQKEARTALKEWERLSRI